MSNILTDIPNMTPEELRAQLDELRNARRKGYEVPAKKVRRDTNPFAGVDPEIVKKVLEEMERRKETQK